MINLVKTKKNEIFHKKDVPNRMMGPIHAFCMQLRVKGIIELSIMHKKRKLIGKSELSPHHVVIKLGVVEGIPSVLIDSYWEQITLVCNG
jgi:hypothetical protein